MTTQENRATDGAVTATRFPVRLGLGATFCLLAAVLFVVGWQGVRHLRQLDREMQEVIYNRWSEEQLVREAFRLSNLNSRITLSIFLFDDPDEIKRLLVQRAANTERISELVRAIESRLDTQEEKRLLAAVEATRKPYVESYRQALAKLIDEHQRDEARKMMVGVTLPRIAVYHAAWNAFTQCQVDKIEQGLKQSKADFAAAQRRLLFLIILAGLITVTIAVYVTFRVTREVAERQRAEEALRQAYDQMEQRIQQRTAELGKTNQALQAEITERKRAEAELKLFRALIDHSIDGIYVMDPATRRFLDVNESGCRALGYTRDELLALTAFDVTTEGNRALFDATDTLMNKAGHATAETRHRRKDGTTYPVEVSLSPVTLDREYLVAIVRDTAERKRAETASIRLAAIIESSDDAIISKDLNSIITSWNKGAERVFGYTASDTVGTSIMRLIPADRRDEENHLQEKIKCGESVDHFETLRQTKDGRLINVSATASPIKDATGKVIGVSIVARDITERKRAEEALQERAKLAALEADVGTALTRGGTFAEMLRLCSKAIVRHLDGAFARIWTLNEREKMLELQASAGRYTHLNGPHGRVPVGKFKIGLIAEERKPHLTNQVVGDPRVGDQEWAKREGMVAFAGYPLLVEDRLVGVVAMFACHTLTDTTLQALASISNNIAVGIERKRAEEALRASQQIIEEIINAIPVRVFWKDRNLVYLGCNAVFARDAGFADPKDIIGKDDYQMGWRDQADLYRGDDRQVIESGCSKLFIEEPQTTPEGNTITLLSSKLPLRNSQGEISGILGTYMDITERKRLEAQLFQSQKMETVGKLAGGIAHEFNSILTAIIGQSELLLNDLPAGDPSCKNATEIRQAAERAATLTRQLLAYGRKQILQPEILDLNNVLAGMDGMLRQLTGGDVDVRIVPAGGLKAVKADAGQIEQVIMNMALNARDAMPSGGQLTLETANVTLDQEYVSRFPELKAGEYVMLAITDTGAGISEEAKARVFEPFFTTKGVGKGTGLGLATCHGIIKQSGGHIAVYSEPGRGATFKMYLPQAEQQVKLSIQRLDSPELPRGTETILLVEDDPALREMAATLLRRLGYTVLAANDGLEALSLTQQKSTGYIDLLFTDVVMPQMSGKELSDRIHALHPNTKILFTSAYTESAIVHQGALNPGVELLQKPFTPSALARKVREVLDGKNGSGNESCPLRSEASGTPVCV